MKSFNSVKAAIAGAGALLLSSAGAMAGDGKVAMETPPVVEDPFDYCDIFKMGKLYESDSGFINSFSLIGRYHGQYYWSDSNQGKADDWENRRFRAGVEIGFAQYFSFEGQFNLNPDEGRFFEDVEDLYIVYEPNDNFYAIVGKVKPKVTREYSTSSKRIKTIERSQMVNQVVPDKIGGFLLGSNFDNLFVEAGIYAGSNEDDWGLPFDGDSSVAASFRIGYDVTEETNVRFDYFYADGAGTDANVEDYEHIFSLNSQSDWGRFHLVTDLIYASGIDNANSSDAWSVVVMPYYDITDKLEAVLRYTYSGSDSDTGVRLQKRYERPSATTQRGDFYQAAYIGLNHYIYDHKLKFMVGLQYADMDGGGDGGDFDGWTGFAGVRMFF